MDIDNEPLKEYYELTSDDKEIQAISIILEALKRRRRDLLLFKSDEKSMALRVLRYCILRIESEEVTS